jgi:Protein of unknown function (DUF2917)
MNPNLMLNSQQWPSVEGAPTRLLRRHQVARVKALGQARWVVVREGQLWLTRSGTDAAHEPADCWLAAGEGALVPAGADAVVEGWSEARYEVLPVHARTISARRVRGAGLQQWWRFVTRLSFLPLQPFSP